MKKWGIEETDRHIMLYCSLDDKDGLLRHLGGKLDTLITDHVRNCIAIFKDARWEESDSAYVRELIKGFLGDEKEAKF